MSAKAKRRQEKGADRAEAFMEKTEIKVMKSKGKSRTVQERAKTWDDVNKTLVNDTLVTTPSETIVTTKIAANILAADVAESGDEAEVMDLVDVPQIDKVTIAQAEEVEEEL